MSSLIGDMFTFPSSSGHPESTQPLGGNIKIAVHDSDTGSVCSSESTKMSSPDDDSESANSSTESDDFAKYCYDPDSSVIRFSSSSFAFDWPQLDDDFTEHEQLQQGEFQALPLDQQTQQQQQQQQEVQQQQQDQEQQQQRTGQVKLTPLIEAARDGNIASLSQLLQEFNKAGSSLDLGQVQVQLSATDGTTALHHAAKTNHLEAVKLLLQHGSFIDETSNLGSTALHFAAANRNLEIVRYLASNGAHVDAKDKYGNTPLSLCLARQYLDVAADLLLFGASIDSKRHLDGRTPLHTACERGHLNVVKFLVENGAKVNQRDECKQTPLLVAICHGRVEVVKFLLSSSVKGIDLKVRDNDGRNIFHNLVLGNNGSGSGSRSSGSRSSKTDGNNNNNNNNNNNSQQQHQIEMLNAISLFCIPNPDLLNVLINEKDTTAHAETPLHLAVVAKNVPVVKRLLEMGADPNMQDRRGNTPLHLCRSAESGAADVSIAKILLKAGAQTEIKNNKGRTSFKQMLRSKLGIDMIGRRRSNSTESKKRSKEIDSAIASRNHKNEVRLLLLGPGESGKSTIAKQMNFLAQRQLSEWETAYYTFSIKKMCVLIMRSILAAAGSELNLELNTDTTTTTTTTIMQSLPSDDELTQSFIEENFSAKIGPLISRLWADPAVQAIYRQTCNKLTDSAKYFMDSIHRISAPEYIATQQDILRLRTKTTGVIETTFELEGVKFWITDVAGQRLHRKTWVPFFEDATAIFFVAGISEFDQTLAEDPTQNCLTEALELFGTITSEPLLRDKPIILFLNKKDIFQEKLQNGGKKLGDYLKDYHGDNTYNDAAKHIQRMFLDRARRPQPPPSPQQQQQQHLIPEESASMLPVSSPPSSGPRIYPFFTNATDASNISNVFDAARDIILAKTMNTSFFN